MSNSDVKNIKKKHLEKNDQFPFGIDKAMNTKKLIYSTDFRVTNEHEHCRKRNNNSKFL